MAKRQRRGVRRPSTGSTPVKGLVFTSAESSRMTGLRDLSVAQRKAAVAAMLKNAK